MIMLQMNLQPPPNVSEPLRVRGSLVKRDVLLNSIGSGGNSRYSLVEIGILWLKKGIFNGGKIDVCVFK